MCLTLGSRLGRPCVGERKDGRLAVVAGGAHARQGRVMLIRMIGMRCDVGGVIIIGSYSS